MHERVTSGRLELLRSQQKHREIADSLVKEIGAISNSLLNALQQLALIDTHVALCDSYDAPIWRLPTETITEIFQYCTETSTGRDITRTPLVLRRVCKYWNSVVSSQPSFWSRLRIDFQHGPMTLDEIDSFKRCVDYFREGPKLDKPFSLGLYIDSFGSQSKHAWVTVMPLVHSCTRLYIGSTKHKWFDLTTFFVTRLPNLESLHMNFYQMEWLRDTFKSAPKLHDLEIIVWQERHCILGDHRLPYSQFTRFSSTMMVGVDSWQKPVQGWIQLLAHFSNLESLEVNFKLHGCLSDRKRLNLVTDMDPHNDNLLIHIPNLRKFVLQCDFPGVFADITSHISIPNLTHLVIDGFHPFLLVSPNQSLSTVLTEQFGYFSGLIELELLRVCLSEDDVRAILETTSQLQKLTLMNYHPSNQWYGYGPTHLAADFLLDMLTVNGNPLSQQLVPKLLELHLFLHLIGPYSSLAARYGALAKSRDAYLKEQSSSNPAFKLHLTAQTFTYPNQKPLDQLNKFSKHLQAEGVMHLISLQSEERRPFAKDAEGKKDWLSTVNPAYPEPL